MAHVPFRQSKKGQGKARAPPRFSGTAGDFSDAVEYTWVARDSHCLGEKEEGSDLHMAKQCISDAW
jgi:hypothetical protein